MLTQWVWHTAEVWECSTNPHFPLSLYTYLIIDILTLNFLNKIDSPVAFHEYLNTIGFRSPTGTAATVVVEFSLTCEL